MFHVMVHALRSVSASCPPRHDRNVPCLHTLLDMPRPHRTSLSLLIPVHSPRPLVSIIPHLLIYSGEPKEGFPLRRSSRAPPSTYRVSHLQHPLRAAAAPLLVTLFRPNTGPSILVCRVLLVIAAH